MKPGFGKSNKKKNKQKKKSGKGKRDGDDIMQDAATVPGSPVQMPAESAAATSPQSVTARDKQRQRMELKKALRVKVANLKSDRLVACAMRAYSTATVAELFRKRPMSSMFGAGFLVCRRASSPRRFNNIWTYMPPWHHTGLCASAAWCLRVVHFAADDQRRAPLSAPHSAGTS